MDIVKFPLGSAAQADLSVSGGNLVLTVSVSAKPEIDALLAKLQASLPADLQPLVVAAQAAIDAELSSV